MPRKDSSRSIVIQCQDPRAGSYRKNSIQKSTISIKSQKNNANAALSWHLKEGITLVSENPTSEKQSHPANAKSLRSCPVLPWHQNSSHFRIWLHWEPREPTYLWKRKIVFQQPLKGKQTPWRYQCTNSYFYEKINLSEYIWPWISFIRY